MRSYNYSGGMIPMKRNEKFDKSFEPVRPFKIVDDEKPTPNKSTSAITRDIRRSFTITQKNDLRHQQDNRCASDECKHSKLDQRTIHYHHIKPWAAGGKTITQNGAALCPDCHELIKHKTNLKNAEKRGEKKPKTKKSDSNSSKNKERSSSIHPRNV